jgi:hypothetical protein
MYFSHGADGYVYGVLGSPLAKATRESADFKDPKSLVVMISIGIDWFEPWRKIKSYTFAPVGLKILNLPMRKRILNANILLGMVIGGPKQPNKIGIQDVYMEALINSFSGA